MWPIFWIAIAKSFWFTLITIIVNICAESSWKVFMCVERLNGLL